MLKTTRIYALNVQQAGSMCISILVMMHPIYCFNITSLTAWFMGLSGTVEPIFAICWLLFDRVCPSFRLIYRVLISSYLCWKWDHVTLMNKKWVFLWYINYLVQLISITPVQSELKVLVSNLMEFTNAFLNSLSKMPLENTIQHKKGLAIPRNIRAEIGVIFVRKHIWTVGEDELYRLYSTIFHQKENPALRHGLFRYWTQYHYNLRRTTSQVVWAGL